MKVFRGIPVSQGVVIGRVFVLDDAAVRVARRPIAKDSVESELQRLEEARLASIKELERVHQEATAEMGEEAAKIFLFHLGMLQDPTLIGPMKEMVSEEHVSAEYAVSRTFREWAARFRGMSDTAFRTKSDDLHDLAQRVLDHLRGEQTGRLGNVANGAVVIARDITPSQAAGFDREKVRAFVTDFGGRTSHTAIVARALNIPAVVGCSGISEAVTEGDSIIVDGNSGHIVLHPDEETTQQYKQRQEEQKAYTLSLSETSGLDCVTADGTSISLMGNIEFPHEAAAVIEQGGKGVGLYRTEFLYLTTHQEPTEEDHYKAYQRCIELLDGKPLTIRTVDLGADKYTQRRAEVPERNPALGCRSIRLCLQSLPMFKTQLRAILRASSLGPVRIMFPLITSGGEFRQAKYVIRDVMEDLHEHGIEFDPDVPIGMMIETPSAAILADSFAREADFFSIGTNDLVQYTLAVDRTNERVADLYNPAHPAVLRLIRETVRAGRRRGIPVSCCGESASDPAYALLLVGLGLRTLSVTASALPQLTRAIRSVKLSDCERIARKAFTFDSDAQVAAYLRDRIRKIFPEAFDGRSDEETG